MPPVRQGGRQEVQGAGPAGTGQWGSCAAARGYLKQPAPVTGKKDLVIWSPESALRLLCITQNLRGALASKVYLLELSVWSGEGDIAAVRRPERETCETLSPRKQVRFERVQ